MKTHQHAQYSNIQFYVCRSTSGLTCWETYHSNQSSILVAQTVTPEPRMCPVERSVKSLPGSFLSMQRDWTKAGRCLTRLQRQTDFVAPIFMHHWQCYSVKSETLATMYATVQNLSTRGEFSIQKRQCITMIMTASIESSWGFPESYTASDTAQAMAANRETKALNSLGWVSAHCTIVWVHNSDHHSAVRIIIHFLAWCVILRMLHRTPFLVDSLTALYAQDFLGIVTLHHHSQMCPKIDFIRFLIHSWDWFSRIPHWSWKVSTTFLTTYEEQCRNALFSKTEQNQLSGSERVKMV